MAKITLVRVPSLFAHGALTLSAIPPLFLAYLAGSLRESGFDVEIIDSIGEAVDQNYYYGVRNLHVNGYTIEQILERIPADTDYIGISFPFSHEWPLAKKVCTAIKEKFPDILIIGGGEHVTAIPEFCLKDCPALDICVLGEGEETVVNLLKQLEAGTPLSEVNGIAYRDEAGETIFTEKQTRIRAIDDIPRPAWDLVPLETYLAGGYSFGVNLGRTIPIIATRGCPYQCTFCSNPFMWTTRWISRKPIEVVKEMEDYIQKYNVQNFDFYDLTAIVRKDWVVEFCNLLIERDLNVTWQLPSGTRSEALDHEVTDLLYRSGCRNLSYAPESGSPETLKKIKKKINPDRMVASVRSSLRNKINIKANFIVGFPDETLKNIFETYGFIIRLAVVGVHDISVWTFSAYPGCEIFDDLKKKGKIGEYSDEYFLGLLSYSDLNNVVSWNDRFSPTQLKYLRFSGLFLFYAVSYLVRPWRLIKNIRNILKGTPESRMEMIVNKALPRLKTKKKSRREEVAVAK